MPPFGPVGGIYESVEMVEKRKLGALFIEILPGLLLVVMVGVAGFVFVSWSDSSVANPLVLSLLLGIFLRTSMGQIGRFKEGIEYAPRFFLPVGIVFYALKNLNFLRIVEASSQAGVVILILVMLTILVSIMLIGKWLGQRAQIACLVAVGSAICGASAIAITSPAINAKSDDVSISLLSVTITALFGLFILLPFLAIIMDLDSRQYSFFAGSLLQFTGFVKAAVSKTPFLAPTMSNSEMVLSALSFKALKYLALVIAIPVFSSMTRGKFYIPPILVLFLVSGIAGTVFYYIDEVAYSTALLPYITPAYSISWAIAMAAIGLNADLRELLSNSGARAMIMSFAGFFCAIAVFFAGLCFLT